MVYWLRLRLYYSIEICWLLFIKVRILVFEFQVVEALALLSPLWTIGVPYWVVISTIGAFVYVTLAFSGGMLISAASYAFLFPSAVNCFVLIPLTLIALYELMLRCVLLCVE